MVSVYGGGPLEELLFLQEHVPGNVDSSLLPSGGVRRHDDDDFDNDLLSMDVYPCYNSTLIVFAKNKTKKEERKKKKREKVE